MNDMRLSKRSTVYILNKIKKDYDAAVELAYWRASEAMMGFNKDMAKLYQEVADKVQVGRQRITQKLKELEKEETKKGATYSEIGAWTSYYDEIPNFILEKIKQNSR